MSTVSRRPAPDGKVYFAYSDIHNAITSLVPALQEWKPDIIIAIGGGGYIPARMLRTELKIPILAVSLELYDDRTNTMNDKVKKVQWFDDTTEVAKNIGQKRVLIVDEVDDTRTTLRYCVDEVIKTNAPAAVAVAVVHNKLKPKKAELPVDVTYFAGEDVPDRWNCYPWDAAAYGRNIAGHEALAAKCRASGGNGQRTLLHLAFGAGLVLAGVGLGRVLFPTAKNAPAPASA